MKEEMGCAPGTLAKGPYPVSEDLEVDRCPHAIYRDCSAHDKLWVKWSIRLANAQKDGHFAQMCPSPGGKILDLIEMVHRERNAQDGQQRVKDKEEMERLYGRK